MNNLQFTGERVVPDKMNHRPDILVEHLARYIFALPYCRGKKVLDAACGTGYGSMIIGAEIGVDYSSKAIEYAKSNYHGIEFVECNLDNNFPDVYFDVITSFETIEHLDNPDYFLHQALIYSELFIFSIPLNMPSEFHKQVFTVNSAAELMNKYFDDIEWYGQDGFNITKDLVDAKYLIGVASNVK